MTARLAFCAVVLAATVNATELRIGNGGEPLTLDPHRYNLNLEEKILADLFEGLTAHDADGLIVPGAAQSWTTSEDGLIWTFRLREGARWSDGAPVTAADFAFSLPAPARSRNGCKPCVLPIRNRRGSRGQCRQRATRAPGRASAGSAHASDPARQAVPLFSPSA